MSTDIGFKIKLVSIDDDDDDESKLHVWEIKITSLKAHIIMFVVRLNLFELWLVWGGGRGLNLIPNFYSRCCPSLFRS